MIMTEKFKILAKYIKDVSSETPDVETFLFVKENISKYQMNIDITSKVLKNKLIEVNTTLKFENDEVKEKKDFEKIILCDVPTAIYPHLEKCFLNLIHDSGHPGIKLEKKVDFLKLYSEKFN